MTAHEFELSGEWAGGAQGAGRLRAASLDFPITWPAELGGKAESARGMSPEELLLGAANSCYLLTFTAIAERLRLPLEGVAVRSWIRVSKERSLVVEQIRHRVVVSITADDEQVRRRVQTTAEQTERGCMFFRAVRGNVPVSVELEIVAPEGAR
jgi:peroxiredoxin-like protein